MTKVVLTAVCPYRIMGLPSHITQHVVYACTHACVGGLASSQCHCFFWCIFHFVRMCALLSTHASASDARPHVSPFGQLPSIDLSVMCYGHNTLTLPLLVRTRSIGSDASSIPSPISTSTRTQLGTSKHKYGNKINRTAQSREERTRTCFRHLGQSSLSSIDQQFDNGDECMCVCVCVDIIE